jgi:pyruvate dehydrogenase E2 component (dihydrolipoamide acetyltransferase)
MAQELRMPQLGLTMTEGTVGNWLKKEGDYVKKGEPILEISTDKLNNEVESDAEGILLKIVAKEGEVIPVQGLLAFIGAEGEKVDSGSIEEVKAVKAEQPAIPSIIEVPVTRIPGQRIKASPLAKKTAAKLGVDLTQITSGSGFDGRIVQKDVIAQEQRAVVVVPAKVVEVIEKTPTLIKETKDVLKPLTNMRRVIGKRMTESKNNAPHVTITMEVIVDKTIALRNKLNSGGDIRLTYTDILVKMTATALRHVPMMNTSIDSENIILHDSVNIGVAVALEEGLIVPVVKDADRKGLTTISNEVKGLVTKAKENKLTSEDMTGGTFTISNLGNYDVDAFTPIINLPESGILGVGRIVKKPIYNEKDEVVPANMMTLSLSFDHRVVDGALAAKFLKLIKDYLEDPDRMYL